MSKKIAVIDFSWAGHIPSYHKLWVQALLDLGNDVVSFSPRPREVLDFVKPKSGALFKAMSSMQEYEPCSSKINHFSFKSQFSNNNLYKFLRAIFFWKASSRLISNFEKQGAKFDRVLFPYIDLKHMGPYLSGSMVDFIFPFYWSGLFLSPREFRRPIPTAPSDVSRLGGLSSKNCRSLGILDEGLPSFFTQYMPHTPVVLCPDVILESGTCNDDFSIKQMRARAGQRRVILLIGELSKKKGVMEFIELAKASKNLPFFFVLVGPLDNLSCDHSEQNQILSEFESLPNFYSYIKRLDNQLVYDSWIRQADYLYAYYPGYYHSSNTLTKAAYFKKPVLTSSQGLLFDRVIKYNLGIPSREGADKQLIDLTLLDKLAQRGYFRESAFQTYYSFHNYSQLKNSLQELIS